MTDFDTIDGGEGEGDELALPRFEERLRLRLAAAHRAHTAGNGTASTPIAAGTNAGPSSNGRDPGAAGDEPDAVQHLGGLRPVAAGVRPPGAPDGAGHADRPLEPGPHALAGDPDGGWGGGPLGPTTVPTPTTTVERLLALVEEAPLDASPRDIGPGEMATAGGARGANRRQRRAARRSLRVGVGGLAAAAAAAVVVTAVTRGPGPADEVAGGPGGPTSPDDLATRIISASQEADATMVVHVTQDNSDWGDDDQWYDETTGSHRFVQHYEDGGLSMDSAGDEASSVVVDHCFSEYLEGPAVLPTGPRSATGWVQRGLEDGSMVQEGTEVVDGRELIRLVERLSNLAVPEPGPDDVIQAPTPDGAEGDAEAWSDEAADDIAALEDRLVDDIAELLATAEAEDEAAAAALAALRTEFVDDATEVLPTAEDHIEAAEDAALEANLAEAMAVVRADPGDLPAEEIAAIEALVAELVADAETQTDPADDEILGITLVDPETYRPVRRIGYPGSDAEYVQDFEYLPRTPENLADLEAEVPAGFTLVDQLRGDGERFDAGCV